MPPAGAECARASMRATRRAPRPRALHRRARRRAARERGAARRRSRPTSCASPGATSTRRAASPASSSTRWPAPAWPAHEAWTQAREAATSRSSRRYLERNIELRRRYSACFPEAEHPYDALLDDYEPGMRTAEARGRPRAPARRPRPARRRGAARSTTRSCAGAVPRGRPARAASGTVLRAGRRRRRAAGAWTTRPTRSRRRIARPTCG